MTLDVLIATHRPDGIRRVDGMSLPLVEGVRYIVSWQMGGDTPVPAALAGRDDVEIHRTESIGLSLNRNDGISRSQADIYLIADDDLSYTAGQLRAVMEAFGSRPDMDVAAFMAESDVPKPYPSAECPVMPYPKGYYPTSFEIAVRRSARTAPLRFDLRFGLGSGVFHLGEEDVFMLSAHRLGLDMRFIPIVITRHDGPTTGERAVSDPKALRAMGAVMLLLYPATFPLRIPLKAWRLARKAHAPMPVAFVRMAEGALMQMAYKVRSWWR